MGINETIAIALSCKSLVWSEFKTTPIEYVAALAGAAALSSDIFRAKQNDRAALRRATLLLAQKARKAGKQQRLYLSPQHAEKLAAAALLEIINPTCRACRGASVVVAEHLKITCRSCDGVGVHQYSDAERAQNCGIDQDKWHQWVRRFEMVIGIARSFDNAGSSARAKLG